MKRRETFALITALMLASACSQERGDASMMAGPARVRTAPSQFVLPGTVEDMIAVLFQNGNVTAALARWSTVRRMEASGDIDGARRQLVLLADFALAKQRQGQLRDPDGESGDATVQDGVDQLLRLMFGELFPGQPLQPGHDVVIAMIDNRAQTVVTPSKHAGFQIGANGTPSPFVLVIDQDPAPYDHCSGPLDTELCQFPLYYRFTPYPDTRLTRRANFGVCTYGPGRSGGPDDEVQHKRMRIAHNLGDHSPGPGSLVVEGVEILPLSTASFIDCEDINHTPTDVIGALADPTLRGGVFYASAIGNLVARVITPRPAYAIDRGGGGEADFFSPFNAVDYTGGGTTVSPPYDGPPVECVNCFLKKPPRP